MDKKYRTPKGISAANALKPRLYESFSEEEKQKIFLLHKEYEISNKILQKRFNAGEYTIRKIIQEGTKYVKVSE